MKFINIILNFTGFIDSGNGNTGSNILWVQSGVIDFWNVLIYFYFQNSFGLMTKNFISAFDYGEMPTNITMTYVTFYNNISSKAYPAIINCYNNIIKFENVTFINEESNMDFTAIMFIIESSHLYITKSKFM